VTFGFVDAGRFRVESSGVGISAAKSRFGPERPRSNPVESCGFGHHFVPNIAQERRLGLSLFVQSAS
jgi:hypothetical protein